MVNKTLSRFALAVLAVSASTLFFSSCGNDSTTDTTDNVDSLNLDTAKENKSVKNVFYSIPSPIELGELISRAGATYDKNLLNDIKNVSKYTTSTSQGLNLGVYGADLSITSLFDQTQESIIYMQCTSSMAKSLGISTAFNNETMSRMDANKGNKDSLLSVITDSYYETDDYLKANQRANVSALVIAGGWIEALYIGSKIAEKTGNEDVMLRIAEMKGSLINLCGLLSLYKGEEGIDPLALQLNELRKVYDGINLDPSGIQVTTDDKSKVTTIGGGQKTVLTKEQFESIVKKASEIRNSIIKP